MRSNDDVKENQMPPTSAPTIVPANDQQPKTNSFLVVLLSILLLISVSIAGFFAYQTQKLVKELRVTSDDSKQDAEATADPTADWKTYTDEKARFSFKYPNNVDVEEQWVGVGENTKGIYQIKLSQVMTIEVRNLIQRQGGNHKETFLPDDTKIYEDLDSSKKYIFFDKGSFSYDISLKDVETEKVFDQILSTFKFINSDSNINANEKEEIETAAKSAFVKKIGQEPTTMYGLAEDSLVVIDDWAFGVITVAPIGEGAGPGANYFLARKINNVWDAKIDYTNDFKEWLKISPNGLVNPDLKNILQ